MRVFYILRDDLPLLYSALKERSYTIYELNGLKIQDKQSFFAESLRSLPMGDADATKEPAVSGWDGFADFFWQGFSQQSGKKSAVLWQDADNLHEKDSITLQQAIEVMGEVIEDIYSEESGLYARPLDLILLLIGHGERYRSFTGDILDTLPSTDFD